MNAAKIIVLVIAAIALFFMFTEPVAAAAMMTRVLSALRDGADAVITFVRNLFS